MNKQEIISLLRKFISQRPGLEFADYGDQRAYRQDYRQILRDLHACRDLLDTAEISSIVEGRHFIEAFESAFSGRLQLLRDRTNPQSMALTYAVGQFFPTEYRKAAAAVTGAAIWYAYREYVTQKGQAERGPNWYPKHKDIMREIKNYYITRNEMRFLG